jgi:molybdenum cofactor cytidylyltransferase
VTTTTKFALDQKDLALEHRIIRSRSDLISVFERIRTVDSLVLTGPEDGKEPKWSGLDLNLMDALVHVVQENGWVLLIEADGSRGKSLKVPAFYEPVLPPQCDLVVPVVGLDAIGEMSISDRIHRTELLIKLLDLGPSDRISTQHVVDVLSSSQGALKDIPPSSHVRVLLNKCDSNRDLKNGREIAQGIVKNQRIQSVLLGSVMEEDPVRESICRVGGVVLAAGASTRLDDLKQLLTFRDKPFVVHAAEAALNGHLDPVVMIVGRHADVIKKALSHYPIRFVENRDPERGQSSSVQLGLEAIQDQVDAVIFLLADMPLVTSDLIRALVEEHRYNLGPVIAPFAEGRRGNPVLFDRVTFDALREVKGDQGGRALFSSYPVVQVEWEGSALFDVDSEEDLRRLRGIE